LSAPSPTAHSVVVGGSTAARVIACPASVRLSATVPPRPSSQYADMGTLLHNVIADTLSAGLPQSDAIGSSYAGQTLTDDIYDEKIAPALAALDAIDPEGAMTISVEARVSYGDWLPGVFGTSDVLGRLGNRAVVLDWKFGDGIIVDAEENAQLMFYAAAAMRTEVFRPVFNGATEIELIIVQPPEVRRWVTTPERIRQFELSLKRAVTMSESSAAPMVMGSHCRFCPAKPICPLMTGAAARAVDTQLAEMPARDIGAALVLASQLEKWIEDLRALAMTMLTAEHPIPDWKLVAKRGMRKWIDDAAAEAALLTLLPESDVMERLLVSPAKAEKALKKLKLDLAPGLYHSISSGTTLARADDPRAEALSIGRQLTAALKHIQ